MEERDDKRSVQKNLQSIKQIKTLKGVNGE